MMPDISKISICIATYKRPTGLERLLQSLARLVFDKCEQPDIRIVVIDNSQDEEARLIVQSIGIMYPFPIQYAVEPTRGIASARNKAVSLAESSDFIAFIDDDEVADQHWLDELLYIQAGTNADVTTGPVLPVFDEEVPKWILKGKFFDRRRLKTGTKVVYAATGNMLIRSNWVKGEPFDTRLSFIGGSDGLFSKQIRQRGALMIWVDEAHVHEHVLPQRATANYIIKRAFRNGSTGTIIEKLLQPKRIQLILRFFKGLAITGYGLILFIPGVILHGYAGLIKSIKNISLGVGIVAGFFGMSYKEYSKSDKNEKKQVSKAR